jgi:hypothetical protein
MFGDVWGNMSEQCMSDELRAVYVVASPCVTKAQGNDQRVRKIGEEDKEFLFT